MAHDWPGNVRELRNVAERTVLGIEAGSPPFAMEPAQPSAQARSLSGTMESIERALIADALRQNEGNLTRTAQALNTPKTTLHDKIRKYGLQ
jgi:two-component system C4-dicarboxylate transport response regulator DctD